MSIVLDPRSRKLRLPAIGLQYHLLEWDADSDHTVLLLHGFLDLSWTWAATVRAGLAGRSLSGSSSGYYRPVIELLVAVGVLVALVAGAFVAALVPWTALFAFGVWSTVAGLALGVPTGFWYHIALARSIRPAPPRWWLRPVSLHARLDPAGRRRVMPWFYAGAIGFMITVFGLVLVGMSIWRSR